MASRRGDFVCSKECLDQYDKKLDKEYQESVNRGKINWLFSRGW